VNHVFSWGGYECTYYHIIYYYFSTNDRGSIKRQKEIEMTKYPLIQALGLNTYKVKTYEFDLDNGQKQSIYEDFVNPSELEKALQDAPVAYGNKNGTYWVNQRDEDDITQARLICVEPIKKKTKQDEALEFVKFVYEELEKKYLTNSETYKKAKQILEIEE